ncbi:MAG: DUF3380 domain-containing protein, partial [Alphaproteobacteria bacterium]|nr:DUF3380 domain-containing protein [Alphaproteobacteria bacterium]
MNLWSWLLRSVRHADPDRAKRARDRDPRTGDTVAPRHGAAMTAGAFARLRDRLKISDAAVWTLLQAARPGQGFLPGRLPHLRFERHIFREETDERFDGSYADLSHPEPGGHAHGVAEYERLKRAAALDRKAALRSASWGLGGVLGREAEELDYGDVESFVDRQRRSEDEHLEALSRLLLRRDLGPALRAGDWA